MTKEIELKNCGMRYIARAFKLMALHFQIIWVIFLKNSLSVDRHLYWDRDVPFDGKKS